jgi:hypothetical protein
MLQNVKKKILVILATVTYVFVFSNVLLYTNVYASNTATCSYLTNNFNSFTQVSTQLSNTTKFATGGLQKGSSKFICNNSSNPQINGSGDISYTKTACTLTGFCEYAYNINLFYKNPTTSSTPPSSSNITCAFLANIYNNGSPSTSLKGYTEFSTGEIDGTNAFGTGSFNNTSCSFLPAASSVSQSSTIIFNVTTGCGSSASQNCIDTVNFYYKTASTSSSSSSYNPINACMFNGQLNGSCYSCLLQNQGNNNFQYIYTDFGCVNSTPSGVVNFIYILAIVISSMLAFITLLIGGFLIMTSSGDPDKVNRGKTLVRNAIIGLIVIILAVVILGLIGSIFNISQIAL